MKTIIINIKRGDVLAEVGRITAYTGVKSDDSDSGALFERVATVEEDAELFARYWRDACAIVAERLKQFVGGAGFGREELSLNLEVSGAFDDSLSPSVETAVFSVIAALLSARWFRLSMKEKAEEWEEEASRLLAEIERMLFHRRAPRRKKQLTSN